MMMMIMISGLFILGVIVEDAYGKAPRKIINGEDAAQGELPYQVSLRIYDRHICGGAIISNRHILTAAHCIVAEAPYSEMTVVTATNSLEPGTGGKAYRVKDNIIHPNYVQQTRTKAGKHDIAVISLRREIVEDDFQRRIPLPTKNTPYNGEATVSGFGRTASDSGSSTILQKARVTLISGQGCLEKGVRVIGSQICGYTGAIISTCKGDSGGPLVYDNEIVGVVSTAGPCGHGYPEVYTRVYSHLDFINLAMSKI